MSNQIVLDNIDAAADRYGVDRYILYGIISKVSAAGEKLTMGLQSCRQGECYGVMRVPLDRITSQAAGPYSQSAIEDGIRWLLDVSQCVCKSQKITKLNSDNAKEISNTTQTTRG